MRFRFPLIFLVFVFSLCLYTSCTKIKGTDIGADLLPAVDNINTFDTTLEVISSNFTMPDSLLPKIGRDANLNQGQFILGHVSGDPQFGNTTGSIFFELKPQFYPFYFENVSDSLYLDSAVLCLRWTNTFGDTNALQTINVFRVTEKLAADSAYNTNTSIAIGESLGSKTFAPSILDDSLYVFRQALKNQLRIKLNTSFARSLLSFDTTGRSPYKTDTLFREFLKGFALVPQQNSTSNALMSFAMSDTATHLRLYYRYSKDGKQDTTFKEFVTFNGIPGGAVNYIKRDYAGSEAINFLGGRPRGDSLIYLQTQPGTYTTLRIPGIDDFKQKKGNVMIHLAMLSMEEVITPGRRINLFPTPQYLYAEAYDEGERKFIPFLNDAFINGRLEAFIFGGERNLIRDINSNIVSAYTFNVTRYLQGIVTRNNPNYPIRLFAPFNVRYEDLFISFALNNLARGNVVLGGGSHPTKRLKFRIIYSKL